jgi:two-component system catabolic regulation response regulator CreB
MSQYILVVEDEPAIADTIVYALQTEGFEPHACATAGDAAATVRERQPALIILDVGLPDQSGFEFCKQVRKSSDIPIIFLTARTDEIDRVVGLEIGGDDYIAKPFSPRELVARVRAVLRRSGQKVAEPDAPPTTPFEIDRNRMKMTYYGVALELSRYEFRILEVLLGRPGWVFSRERLMEHAWDAPECSTDRTVDTHIKTIRAKLREVNPEVDPIVTHRGLGYSLKESW